MSSPFPDGPRERCGPATRWTEASPRVLMSLGSNCSTQEAQSKGLRHTSRASGSVRVQSPPTSHQGPWPPNRCVPLGSFLLTNHQLLAREDGAGEGPCPLLPLSLTDPDAMAEGPHFHARRREWGGGQRPGDVVLYMVYQPLTGGPYRQRIRRCQSRWLFFVRQPAHVV